MPMHIKKRTGPSLPQSLKEELQSHDSNIAGTQRKRSAGFANRKAERKAERQSAKQRKAEHFFHARQIGGVKRAAPVEGNEIEDNRPLKRRKLPPVPNPPTGPSPDTKSTEQPETKKKSEKETRKDETNVPRLLDGKESRSRVDEEEDAYIASLEKRLGIKKSKGGRNKYGTGFEQDGLLDLLSGLDEKYDEPNAEDLHSRSVTPASAAPASSSSELVSDDVSNDSWSGFGSSLPSESESESTTNAAAEKNNLTTTLKYVPPHLRKVAGGPECEPDAKLSRLLKGHLNRLTEQNIDSILREIEAVYRSYRRHDVTSTLTNLIVEGTCLHSTLLDSYVALHAGLVACLHKIIGVDFVAYFVQTLVGKFELHYASSHSEAQDHNDANADEGVIGKECSNLLVLLTDLYNYRVIACTLMYDIIRLIFEGDLAELDVELILKVAKGCGSQLRQDDPSALKDIIQIIQSKLGDQTNPSSRTRFMVETLNNLKNNKMKHGAANAHGGSESKERISKFVAGIGKKYHVHAHEPLRVSLEDLHQADSMGKWWLVGAAWGGDPLVDQQSTQPQSADSDGNDVDNQLMKLARKQGMNTDVRRSVFVVLMSSEDYADACDRLMQLNLTDVQQREIIRVLLHCCGNEKAYNPYYTLIGQHLCRQSHSHRITLQYRFWDFLRSLGEKNVGGEDMANLDQDEDDDEGQDFELDRISKTRMANVARAYAWWVAKGCLAITILKTLDFIALKKKTVVFLRAFFDDLFVYSQDPSPVPALSSADSAALSRRDAKSLEAMILKATRAPALAQGIIHFLSSAFKEMDDQNEKLEDFTRWACDAVKDALRESLETGGLG